MLSHLCLKDKTSWQLSTVWPLLHAGIFSAPLSSLRLRSQQTRFRGGCRCRQQRLLPQSILAPEDEPSPTSSSSLRLSIMCLCDVKPRLYSVNSTTQRHTEGPVVLITWDPHPPLVTQPLHSPAGFCHSVFGGNAVPTLWVMVSHRDVNWLPGFALEFEQLHFVIIVPKKHNSLASVSFCIQNQNCVRRSVAKEELEASY